MANESPADIYLGTAGVYNKMYEDQTSRLRERAQQADFRSQHEQAQQKFSMQIKEYNDKQADKQLMAKAFPINAAMDNTKQGANISGQKIQQLMRARDLSLHSGNPKAAAEYENMAFKEQDEADKQKRQGMEIQQKTAEAAGEALSSASDQESWDRSKEELTKLGVKVPLELKNFDDPKTQQFINSKLMGSKAGKEAIGLSLKVNADQRADRKAKEGEKTRLLNDQLIEKKLAATRSGGKPWKQDQMTHDIVANRLMLNEEYKNKGMNSKTKGIVADAISQKAFDLVRDPDNKVSSTEAYAMAEQQVMSRVDQDGNYTPEKAKSGAKPPVSKTPPTAADRAYVKAHPETSAQFIDHFGVDP
jgi:hypothetical protein